MLNYASWGQTSLTVESWHHYRLSKVTSVPFFHLPEHSEDGNICFTGLSDTMDRETQNDAGHVGGAQ